MKEEFADLRRREMPTGRAHAKLALAGALDCHSCGKPSRREMRGFACCEDATCSLHAQVKADYARLTQPQTA
jgi:hypothetical protein